MLLTITEKQNLADKFTVDTMTAVYGERFSSLEDVEDDEELTKIWDTLNESFYDLITNVCQ